MSDNTKVSIALATYNGARFISEQLESIANQTYLPYEIVVCDDASADATVEIIEAFSTGLPITVRVYRNVRTLGYVENFEKAILHCRGDIVVLSDQDDVWFPNKLKRIVEEFNRDDACGLVFHDAEVVDANQKPLGYTLRSRGKMPNVNNEEIVSVLLKQRSVKGCTMAFRSSLIKYVRPIAEQGWGHDNWILFVLGMIAKVRVINEPLMYYRSHSDNFGMDVMHKSFMRKLLRPFDYLNVRYYEGEKDRWLVMLNHMRKLLLEDDGDLDTFALQEGITKTKERYLFAKQRYNMFFQRRLSRFVLATRFFLNGKYKAYRNGYRSYLKDIIVAIVEDPQKLDRLQQ